MLPIRNRTQKKLSSSSFKRNSLLPRNFDLDGLKVVNFSLLLLTIFDIIVIGRIVAFHYLMCTIAFVYFIPSGGSDEWIAALGLPMN